MVLELDRIGKVALFAAMTNMEEEKALKRDFKTLCPDFKLAITFISGLTTSIRKKIVQSVIACTLQNEILEQSSSSIHAVMHASLEAFEHIRSHIPVDASLKMKVAIVTDGKWVAVAIYGDSAIQTITNHERVGLGIMHL